MTLTTNLHIELSFRPSRTKPLRPFLFVHGICRIVLPFLVMDYEQLKRPAAWLVDYFSINSWASTCLKIHCVYHVMTVFLIVCSLSSLNCELKSVNQSKNAESEDRNEPLLKTLCFYDVTVDC